MVHLIEVFRVKYLVANIDICPSHARFFSVVGAEALSALHFLTRRGAGTPKIEERLML